MLMLNQSLGLTKHEKNVSIQVRWQTCYQSNYGNPQKVQVNKNYSTKWSSTSSSV